MNVSKKEIKKEMVDIMGGRSIDEQISYIEKYGSHGLPEVIKAQAFAGTARALASETAENVVFLGCYHPSLSYEQVVAYFELLKILGVEFACLEKEYCCGVLLIKQDTDDNDSTIQRCREFVKRNSDAANLKKAKRIAYFCCQCAYTAKFLIPEEADRHVYALDIILEALKGRSLKLPPTRAGYFEGCHTSKMGFPEIDMNWKAYRKTLDSVEGLSVEEIPNKNCCQTQSDKILSLTHQKGLETLICPCSTCAMILGSAIGDNLKIITLSEMLLDACNDWA